MEDHSERQPETLQIGKSAFKLALVEEEALNAVVQLTQALNAKTYRN